MALRLRLLGSPAVETDGGSTALPCERRTQIAAYLALKGTWVGRAELASMLWPDVPAKLAFTNLRKALFRLQALPWGEAVEMQTGALRLACDTDVRAFDRALREDRIADALTLHGGDLLPGFEDDAGEAWSLWLNFERERLRASWRRAVLARLDAGIDPSEGVELSARLLHADTLDESALRTHVAWLARAGQPARARDVCRQFTERLSDELGLAPSQALVSLQECVAVSQPPRPPVSAAPWDDGFVGRHVELRQIATLLADESCRLVSIVGPGGIGKTRLARRALAELLASHDGESAFVSLEDAATCNDVAALVANALRVPLAPGIEPIEQLAQSLEPRPALLVLDNFEHLTSQAPTLQALLDRCPRLKAIVTSRVRLGLRAEQLLPLDGLPCPDPEDVDRLEAFDAARLFVRSAKRVVPAFPAERESAAIVEICRLVEGLPLALELAAAWTRVMPCGEIVDELRRGPQLLRAQDATHPARHASMEAVFEQTWRHLVPLERDALARLSVFQGGFTPEAARAVASAPLPVIGALVDKSLLRREGDRLRMHALVQELSGRRLDASGGMTSSRRAHAAYFHRWMAQRRRHVQDGKRDALQAMEAELENCRAAWQWVLDDGAPEPLALSVPMLMHFCDHRFRVSDGLDLLLLAIESPSMRERPKLAALLSAWAAHMLYRMDRYPDAETRARASLDMAEGDRATRLQCFKVLGGCCLRLGRLEEARGFFRQALNEAPATIDPVNAAAMLDNLALVEKSLGRYAESSRLSRLALLQLRALDDVAGEALCLNNLADLHMGLGERDLARGHLRDSLAICERHGLVATRALVLANLMELALQDGDTEAAEFHAHRAMEIVQSTGNRALAASIRMQGVGLALRRRDLAAARRELAAGAEIAIALRRPMHLFLVLMCFADVLAAQGEGECARQVFQFAADDASQPTRHRDHARDRLAALPPSAESRRGWPGLAHDDLVHRIVEESAVAYAPLIAQLRAAQNWGQTPINGIQEPELS